MIQASWFSNVYKMVWHGDWQRREEFLVCWQQDLETIWELQLIYLLDWRSGTVQTILKVVKEILLRMFDLIVILKCLQNGVAWRLTLLRRISCLLTTRLQIYLGSTNYLLVRLTKWNCTNYTESSEGNPSEDVWPSIKGTKPLFIEIKSIIIIIVELI